MKELTNDIDSGHVRELLKVGAQAMLSNLLEHKEYRDGVLQLMENHNRIETGELLFVAPYYNYCCQAYVAEGKHGLYRIFQQNISPNISAPIFTMDYINSVYIENYERYFEDNK